jgi:hypothetical protein
MGPKAATKPRQSIDLRVRQAKKEEKSLALKGAQTSKNRP